MLWSWVLAIWTCTGLTTVALGWHRTGWIICLSAQVPWTLYAVVTYQYGFILSVILHIVAYTMNYRSKGAD